MQIGGKDPHGSPQCMWVEPVCSCHLLDHGLPLLLELNVFLSVCCISCVPHELLHAQDCIIRALLWGFPGISGPPAMYSPTSSSNVGTGCKPVLAIDILFSYSGWKADPAFLFASNLSVLRK